MNYSPKYWNSKAADQDTYDKLFKKLVPESGEAETEQGELISAISAFTHDQYNNGHCNFQTKSYRYSNMVSSLSKLNVPLNKQAKCAVASIEVLLKRFQHMEGLSDWVDKHTQCDNCDGSGEVFNEYRDEDNPEEMETCEICSGSGEIYDDDIPSEQEEEMEKLEDLLDTFSDTSAHRENLDQLTHCIIQYVDDIFPTHNNQSISEMADTVISIEEEEVVPVEKEATYVPSQEFYDYIIGTIGISEEQFHKASKLYHS